MNKVTYTIDNNGSKKEEITNNNVKNINYSSLKSKGKKNILWQKNSITLLYRFG